MTPFGETGVLYLRAASGHSSFQREVSRTFFCLRFLDSRGRFLQQQATSAKKWENIEKRRWTKKCKEATFIIYRDVCSKVFIFNLLELPSSVSWNMLTWPTFFNIAMLMKCIFKMRRYLLKLRVFLCFKILKQRLFSNGKNSTWMMLNKAQGKNWNCLKLVWLVQTLQILSRASLSH